MSEINHFQKIREVALKLLARRPQSRKEITEKLGKFARIRRISMDTVFAVTDDLSSINMLNDKDFAYWWVDQRKAFSPRGKKALTFELQQKGIHQEIISEVLNHSSKEEEYKEMLQITQKKLDRIPDKPIEKQKKTLINYLVRRGYDFDMIDEVIDSLIKKS